MAPQTEQKIYVGIGLDFETGGLDCRECACTQIALQAVRFDTWQVFDRYQAYIAPYGKQDAGLPRRKVLRTRHEQAKGQEYVPMKYEQARKRMLAEQQYGSVRSGYALYSIPHPGDVYHGVPSTMCRTVWRV